MLFLLARRLPNAGCAEGSFPLIIYQLITISPGRRAREAPNLEDDMNTVHIIALHLAFGGVEKAIINMANLFVERYNVEIISVYKMPGSPAYPLDERVKVRYLLKDIPNRTEWKAAVREVKPLSFIKQSARAVKILAGKKLGVIEAIKGIDSGIIITTRHEDNLLLSRFGRPGTLKIAQLHHDHNFEAKYVNAFKNSYSNIDYFTLLTPGLAEEVGEMMRGGHTETVYIPNFIDSYPEKPDFAAREKTVLAAGRLNYVKRFDKLIKTFARVHAEQPEWRLKIVGEGEEREALECLIDELGAQDYISLCGVMNAEQIEREMCRAGIYAMTSASEGFSFVVLEAQSCYLPSVAFDVRVGPPFLIEDGVNGCLVPDGDDSAFAAKLVELMMHADEREALGEAARVRSLDFSRERVGKLWFDILGD